MYVMTFYATKNPFKNQLRHDMTTYHFFLQSLSIIHVRVYFVTALYIMISRMSTFLSRTHFSAFSVYLFSYE